MRVISETEAKKRADEAIYSQLRERNLIPSEMDASTLHTFQEIGSLDAFHVLILLGLIDSSLKTPRGEIKYIEVLDFGYKEALKKLTQTNAQQIIEFLTKKQVEVFIQS